ncbi:hypothetical protein ACHHYP_03317 [Achlya hypogyna]|uniref:Uncharacterized protein n=1 Tax=Achlya hypogyna TaxID=1202772 RepID=A0A1V9Z434_ACHHY|nr:hypothetical protein ACHHYP_03317 [Achlya hypogyna]
MSEHSLVWHAIKAGQTLSVEYDDEFELGPPPPMHMTPTLVRQSAVDMTLPCAFALPSPSSMRKLCFTGERRTSLDRVL